MSNMTKPDSFKHSAAIQASLKKRYARERRFQWYGRLAVLTGFVFLFILLADIVSKGSPAFTQQFIKVSVNLDMDKLDLPPNPTPEQLFSANYLGVIKASLRDMFPAVSSRKDKQQLYRLLSAGAEYNLRDMVIEDPALLGHTTDIWLRAHAEAGSYLKGQVDAASPESDRRVKDLQIGWLDQLSAQGRTESRFNIAFFTNGDSREPEMAGIRVALYGSFFTLLVTFAIA